MVHSPPWSSRATRVRIPASLLYGPAKQTEMDTSMLVSEWLGGQGSGPRDSLPPEPTLLALPVYSHRIVVIKWVNQCSKDMWSYPSKRWSPSGLASRGLWICAECSLRRAVLEMARVYLVTNINREPWLSLVVMVMMTVAWGRMEVPWIGDVSEVGFVTEYAVTCAPYHSCVQSARFTTATATLRTPKIN